MFIVIYYDPSTNRIDHYEINDKEAAYTFGDGLVEGGAPVVKILEVRSNAVLAEHARTNEDVKRRARGM